MIASGYGGFNDTGKIDRWIFLRERENFPRYISLGKKGKGRLEGLLRTCERHLGQPQTC